MKDIKLLSNGIQTFSHFKEENRIYVDKTDLLYKLTHENFYVFLPCPRRFGRSLIISTLKAYFEGRRDLFEGLKIYSHEKEWKKHPVIKFDFSGEIYSTENDLEIALDHQLRKYEDLYQCTKDDSYSITRRFRQLIKAAYEQTGERVVILVDEYDAPFLECPPEYLESYQKEYYTFFENLKCLEEYMEFAFIAGVTNDPYFCFDIGLADIARDYHYATLCGITEEELIDNYSPYIEKLASKYNYSIEKCLARLKEMYGGYRFHEDAPEVYNLNSVLNCFDHLNFGYYWFETGTPTFLVKRLVEEDYDISEYLSKFELSSDDLRLSDIISTLYQTGYLTIQSYDTKYWFHYLKIPNKEVESAHTSLSKYVAYLKKQKEELKKKADKANNE